MSDGNGGLRRVSIEAQRVREHNEADNRRDKLPEARKGHHAASLAHGPLGVYVALLVCCFVGGVFASVRLFDLASDPAKAKSDYASALLILTLLGSVAVAGGALFGLVLTIGRAIRV